MALSGKGSKFVQLCLYVTFDISTAYDLGDDSSPLYHSLPG